MPTRDLPRKAAIDTVRLYHAARLEGMTRNQAAHHVAKQLSVGPSTIRARLDHSIPRTYPDIEINHDLTPPPPEVFVAPQKPRVVVKAGGEVVRVCAIGDLHDSPKLTDKSRFTWIGRHIATTKPDKVVQIGDFGDWNSCSTHEAIGSIDYAERPSYKRDVDSMEQALNAMYRETGGDFTMHLLEGNHEDRIDRFENAHPETNGLLREQIDGLYARFNWRPMRFGQWLFIAGVGFTHVPKTIMGRPYGGKFSENQIGNDAVFSIVYGHTHRAAFRRAPKIGPQQSIEILNLGSAMPDGYVASYAGTAMTGWTYGIYDLRLRGGHIENHRFISMHELEELYG